MTVFTRQRGIQSLQHDTNRTDASSIRDGWPFELWGLLAVALVLRLPGLLQFDLWQDEIYSIYEAKYLYDSPIGPGGIELRALYFWLLHPLADAHPHATALLRLPSLALGLAGIAATWLLARRLLGRTPAFVAGALLVALPLHIDASQIIRWIAFVWLIGALFASAVMRALDTDRTQDHLQAALWLATGTLTHITFLMPAFGMVLGAHLVRPDASLGLLWPSRRAWTACWLPFLLGSATYYTILWLVVPSERLMGEAAGSAARLIPGLAFHLTPAVLSAALIGMAWLMLQRNAGFRRLALMTFGALAVPTVVMITGGLLRVAAVSVVYYSGGLALLVICVAAAGAALRGGLPLPRSTGLVLAALLLAALAPSTVSHLMDGSRFDFRDPLGYIATHDPRGTVALYPVIHARWEQPELNAIEVPPSTPPALLDSLRLQHHRFWAIAAVRRSGAGGEPARRRLAWLHAHCQLIQTYGRPRVDYEQYDTLLFECQGPPAPGHVP